MIPFPSDITSAVYATSIGDASLFTNILPTCRPIATRSRHFSVKDKAFIQSEIVNSGEVRHNLHSSLSPL